ncbi:ROK family protein [Kineococcus aurantiacus]|uniref:Glucokinase n=1 Tax=Kineococcus aurantiacus TaxID=37633 RepID=A0A7Y9AS87_9ACTN|nr:glucokinase [Kineococcus aurantiacus]
MIGIDVGGTTVKGLALDAGGTVLAEHRAPTPAPDPDGRRVAAAVGEVARALRHRPGDPVGVALPGIVDETTSTAVLSANLGWADVAFGDLLGDLLGSGALVCHDVRAGAVAEARTGAARGAGGVVAFVPVGTGISAAVLLDGVPLVAGGFAGEIGQLVLADGPFRGRRTEDVASAAATARRAGLPGAVDVARAIRAGDAAAQRVWSQTVDVLGQSLAGLVAVVAPDVLVVGGGLALAGDLLLDPLRTRLTDLLPGLRVPRLVPAAHGDTAAARGAALLAGDAS